MGKNVRQLLTRVFLWEMGLEITLTFYPVNVFIFEDFMVNMSYFEDSLKNIKHPNVIFSIDSVIQKMFLLDNEGSTISDAFQITCYISIYKDILPG